ASEASLEGWRHAFGLAAPPSRPAQARGRLRMTVIIWRHWYNIRPEQVSHAGNRPIATIRGAEIRGADRVRYALVRRRQVGDDAGGAHREGRAYGCRARHRHR